MANKPRIDELVDVIIEEKVRVVSYGKGNHQRLLERTKPHGISNVPTMGALRHALRAEQDGADAVIVRGCEAGGQTRFVTTLILVPLEASKLRIAIIAAGGIGNGKGLVAALALGAEGISM